MRWLIIVFAIYVFICGLLYLIQERLIFFPDKMQRDASFHFDVAFEELFFKTEDGAMLHGILFNSSVPKGVIFYLHGNAGSLESWGDISEIYTSLGYDLFMLDYRGYGKSEGSITSEKQLHQDAHSVFNALASRYRDQRVIVLGYSLGAAPAAKLAAEKDVDLLILQSPYYSMTDVMKNLYKILPPVILRYKLKTYKYVEACNAPIVIFHGDEDEIIDHRSSLKLKQHLKPTDKFVTIRGLGHNGMSHHPEYLRVLQVTLNF